MSEVGARLDSGTLRAVAATLTLTEVLTQPLRLNRQDVAAAYRRILEQHPAVRLVDLDPAIAAHAAELRARHGQSVPLHLEPDPRLRGGAERSDLIAQPLPP